MSSTSYMAIKETESNESSLTAMQEALGSNQGDQSNDMVAHVKHFGMPQGMILEVVS